MFEFTNKHIKKKKKLNDTSMRKQSRQTLPSVPGLLTPRPEDRTGGEKENRGRQRDSEKCMCPYFALLKTSISSRSRLSFRDTEEVLAKTLRTTPDSAPMNTTV